MSKQTGKRLQKGDTKGVFQVKEIRGGEIAAITLEELSHDYGDVCNYLEAAALARSGQLYLSYISIEQQNKSRGVSSARQHWAQAQALAAVKKLTDPDIDRWSLTKDKWFDTERRCSRINAKFLAMGKRREAGVKPVPFSAEQYRFYEALVHVLGDAPPVDDITESAYYGPGSSVEIRGREVHYVRKVDTFDCTPLAIDLAVQALLHDKAAWSHVGMDPVYSLNPDAQEGFKRVMRDKLSRHSVRSDRLMFIHKGIESLRSIGAQPTVSGMLQLGVHSVVTPWLKAVGVDLEDQGWNQHLAKLGSKDWQSADPMCTLDKSDASNLVAKELVAQRFPPAWAKLLGRIRTPSYEAPPELGGGVHDYEMYAGMGNGTTFVVETLIFWAAAYATSESGSVSEFVSKRKFAIYGDDVVLPRSHALRYMQFARFLGFKFNTKKTFTDGPFRESCGCDYYSGVNVRPATLDSEKSVVDMATVIGFHNTLADQHDFPLLGACRRIRNLFQLRFDQRIPTDPFGNLGFRPIGTSGYSFVRNKQTGIAQVSPAWQRPRTYVLSVTPLYAGLDGLDSWTQIAVALLRGRQSLGPTGQWSLPVRTFTTVKIIPEQDLSRGDLIIMLRNQLGKLAVNKTAPWFEQKHGVVDKK